MEWRKNQGFFIVNQITVGSAEFVLGVHEKNPNSFVTWQCKGKDDYFWGQSKQCKFYKTHKKYRDDLKKYPPCDYADIYAKRHKNDMKGYG